MYFDYTPDEQRRVALASLLGIHIDPIGYADLAVIVILSTIYFIDVLAAAFILWNHRYPPIKAKYPILMSTCILALIIWFLGDLVLKSHIHVRGPILSDCTLWCVWMRVIFGCFLISALISIRSFALFCIFRKNCAYRGKYVYWSWGILITVACVFILLTYLLPQHHAVYYLSMAQMCDMGYTYRAIVQGLLWLTWTVNALINYRLRNITSSFNESREMSVACITVFVLLSYNTIILYVYPLYPTKLSLRVSETLLSHLLANFLWWFIMYKCTLNCLLRRHSYLAHWKAKLVADGLQRQYQVNQTTGQENIDPFAASEYVRSPNQEDVSAKLVTLRRNTSQRPDEDENTRLSSSIPISISNHSSNDCIWYPNSNKTTEKSEEEKEEEGRDRNDAANMFSPQHPQNNNSSSSTTVLSQYHFPK